MNTFATAAAIAATLDIPAGRVQIVASDRSDATVDVRPADASKARDAKAAEQTAVDFSDGHLRIAAPTKDGAVEVTVQLPAGSRVEVRAAATAFRSVGRLGDVTVDGAYQQIKLDEAASLHLTAVEGDVQVGRLNGRADISTAKGDIRIAEARQGQVVLRTQSGDISIAAAVSASLDAGTSYGRVTNSLRNDGSAELEIQATTSHGDIVAKSL